MRAPVLTEGCLQISKCAAVRKSADFLVGIFFYYLALKAPSLDMKDLLAAALEGKKMGETRVEFLILRQAQSKEDAKISIDLLWLRPPCALVRLSLPLRR